jgi:hypothetical protein
MELFNEWLKRPFSQDMDAQHWALFIGFFLVLMVFWRYILSHIVGGIE